MDLTLNEFAGFSTKSKGALLAYKGFMLKTKTLNNQTELQLFSIGNFFAICHFCQKTNNLLAVQTSVNTDWLYYFVADINLMAYLPELGAA